MSRRLGPLACMGAALMVVVVSGFGWLLRGDGSDHYSFLAMDGGDPVTFSHCRPITYQVNPYEAPAHWQTIVRDAFAAISSASGFRFVDAGTTTKRQLFGGGYYQGNAPEPVLITWSDILQSPGLSDAWGYGGPVTYDIGSHVVALTGRVVMGTQPFRHYRNVSDDQVQTLVLEHEIGHVLGLGHVNDHRQLMNNGYVGQSGLGKGDVNGLHRLYQVPCH